MLTDRFCIACRGVRCAVVLALFLSASPQDAVDREAYAREYVQFLRAAARSVDQGVSARILTWR